MYKTQQRYFMLPQFFRGIAESIIYCLNGKKNLMRLATLEREQAFNRYEILSNQLNPHFLFNALTSVNSLIFENQSLASDFLLQLSKVYRYVLQNKKNETVSISTEIEFVTNYIRLLQTRFANAIEFDICLNKNCKDKKIVPVTLQILIENAVKHNVASRSTPLKISITCNDSFVMPAKKTAFLPRRRENYVIPEIYLAALFAVVQIDGIINNIASMTESLHRTTDMVRIIYFQYKILFMEESLLDNFFLIADNIDFVERQLGHLKLSIQRSAYGKDPSENDDTDCFHTTGCGM
jgi:hypothetical protein